MQPYNLFTGTTGWSYEEWSGELYPEFTPREQFLEIYSEKFRAVELAGTAVRVPSPDTFRRWRSRTPDDFKFAPVAPRAITHEKQLVGVDVELATFLTRCELLGGNLGPILFQFPYTFNIDRLPDMTTFIRSLPDGFSFVIEVRRRRWLNKIFIDHLREYGVSLAIIDMPWMSRTAELDTAKTVYLRFLGDRRHNRKYGYTGNTDRSKLLSSRSSLAARRVGDNRPVFAFFSNQFEGYAPRSADSFSESVVKILG